MGAPGEVTGRTKCERMEATISRVVEPETAEEGRRGRGTTTAGKKKKGRRIAPALGV